MKTSIAMGSSTTGEAPLLPQIPGPKLAPFTPTAHADIKFIELIGNPDDKDAQV